MKLPKKISDLIFILQERYQNRFWWRAESALLTAALIFGSLSGCLSHYNKIAERRAIQELYESDEVLVASIDMLPGNILTKDSITTVNMLKTNITKNYLHQTQISKILGKQISIELKAGDPILISSLIGGSLPSDISDKIPQGKRLFTLKIMDLGAANGFFKANDHVDIMAHIPLPNRGLTTFTVLQDITLVSVGQSLVTTGSRPTPASDISFFIDASDSEMMAFAQKQGKFTISLRNPKDMELKKSNGTDINDFLDHAKVNPVSGGGALTILERGKAIQKGSKQ